MHSTALTPASPAQTWLLEHPESKLAIAWRECLESIEATHLDALSGTKSQLIAELNTLLDRLYLADPDLLIILLEFLTERAGFLLSELLFVCRKASEFQDKIENILLVSRLYLTPGSMISGIAEDDDYNDIFRQYTELTSAEIAAAHQTIDSYDNHFVDIAGCPCFYWAIKYFSAKAFITEMAKPQFHAVIGALDSCCFDYRDNIAEEYTFLDAHPEICDFWFELHEEAELLEKVRLSLDLVKHLVILDPDCFHNDIKATPFETILVALEINTDQLQQIFTLKPSEAIHVYNAIAMAISDIPKDKQDGVFIDSLIAIMAQTDITEIIQALNDLTAGILGGGYTRITEKFLTPAAAEAPVARREIPRGPALDDKQITHTASVHQSTSETILMLLTHYCPAAVSKTETGELTVIEKNLVEFLIEKQETLEDVFRQVLSSTARNIDGKATLSSLSRLLHSSEKAGEGISIKLFIRIALLAIMDETQYREGVTKETALAAFRAAFLEIATDNWRKYDIAYGNPSSESLPDNTIALRIEGANLLYKVRDPFDPKIIHEGSISLETLGCPIRSLSTLEDKQALQPYLKNIFAEILGQGHVYGYSPICISGSFNKVVEKLYPIHQLFVMRVITKTQAADSLPPIAKQEMLRTLEEMNADDRTAMIDRLKTEGTLEPIWTLIEKRVKDRLWEEYQSLYQSEHDDRFVALLENGVYVAIDPKAFDRFKDEKVIAGAKKVRPRLLNFLWHRLARFPTLSESTTIEIPEETTIQDFGGGGNCLFLALAGQLAESDVGAVAANLRELVVGALTENIETLREWVEAARSDVHLRFAGGNEKIASASRYLELIAQPGTWGGEIEIGHLAVILGRPIAVYGAGYQRLYPSNVTEEGTATYEGELLMLQYTGNHYQALTATPERAEQILAELVVEFAQSTPIGGAGGPSGGAGGPAGGAGGSSASAVTAFYPQPDETLRQQAGRNHQGKSGTKQSDSASDSDEEKPRENKKRRADTPEPS